MRALGVLLVLAATGCAPQYQATRPGATQAQMQVDVNQCQYEAVAYSNPGYRGPAFSMGHAVAQGVSTGIDQAVRQEQLMALCLQAKGWTAERGYQSKGGPTVKCRKADGIVFYTSKGDCPGVVEG